MSIELFDSLMKMDDKIQKLRRIRELQWELNKPYSCGDCHYWMKSRLCPQEVNVNGYSRGPSCGGIICEKFKTAYSTIERREKLKKELQEVSGD